MNCIQNVWGNDSHYEVLCEGEKPGESTDPSSIFKPVSPHQSEGEIEISQWPPFFSTGRQQFSDKMAVWHHMADKV